jgi:DNA polymerase-3 subunit beta
VSQPDCIITASRSALIASLDWCAPIAKEKSPHPLSTSVLIVSTEQGTTFTTTDFDQTAVVKTAIEPSVGETRACLPARRLLESIKAFPNGTDVSLAITGPNAVLTGTGTRRRFDLPGFPHDEFPNLDTDTFSDIGVLPGPALADGLRRVQPMVSEQYARPELCAVRLDARDGMMRVASYNGSSASVLAPIGKAEIERDNVLLYGPTIAALIKLADDNEILTLSVSERRVRFSTGFESLTVRVVEGKYPNVDMLYAITRPNGFVLDSKELLAAIKTVALAGDEKTGYRMEMDWDTDELILTVQTERGTATDTVAYVERFAGPIHLTGAMNYTLLADAIGAVKSDLVRIDIGNPKETVKVSDPQHPDAAVALVAPFTN